MLRSLSQHETFLTTALLSSVLCCGPLTAHVAAQENTAETVAAIQQSIAELGSPVFKTRIAAANTLRDAGDAAILPLQQAEQTASGDRKTRIQEILKELKRNTFIERLEQLKKTPAVKLAGELPEWERFAEIVGSDEPSIRMFTRLLAAETALFTASMKKSRDLPTLLQARAAELLHSVRPAAIQRRPFSADSYAALLLLASNKELTLGAASTSISDILVPEESPFVSALKQEDGERLLRLVGAYIQRGRIGVLEPLEFARRHPMPAGPILARQVLKTALRGHNGIPAMMLLLEQGNKADIALLESLFDHQGKLFEGRTRSANNVVVTYTAVNGDMALAVAIAMREQDPREFGFGKELPHTITAFRFIEETIGFDSDEERRQAREKYDQLFRNRQPK
jgi:hypothetical protein